MVGSCHVALSQASTAKDWLLVSMESSWKTVSRTFTLTTLSRPGALLPLEVSPVPLQAIPGETMGQQVASLCNKDSAIRTVTS